MVVRPSAGVVNGPAAVAARPVEEVRIVRQMVVGFAHRRWRPATVVNGGTRGRAAVWVWAAVGRTTVVARRFEVSRVFGHQGRWTSRARLRPGWTEGRDWVEEGRAAASGRAWAAAGAVEQERWRGEGGRARCAVSAGGGDRWVCCATAPLCGPSANGRAIRPDYGSPRRSVPPSDARKKAHGGREPPTQKADWVLS